MSEGRLAHSANLEGQVALVTGASRGIGQAIALALGQAGATVIGTATSDKGAQAISDYLAAASIKGGGMKLNVTDAAEVDAVIAAISAQFGDIGILVNNAGITRDQLLVRMKPEEWRRVLDINLDGVFNVTQPVAKLMMRQRSGRIVSVASVVGLMGNAGQTNYAASKAGLIGFTKSLARELGPRNVTVNAIAPGFITSPMTDALSEEQRAQLLASVAIPRLGVPADVAEAVAFLAGPHASYITGVVLNVSGGLYM